MMKRHRLTSQHKDSKALSDAISTYSQFLTLCCSKALKDLTVFLGRVLCVSFCLFVLLQKLMWTDSGPLLI